MAKIFTRAQLAKHNTKEDCWVSLDDKKVYDLTNYVKHHPGGVTPIVKFAGKDITAIMKDDDSHEHSEHAYEMMEEFLVGYLVSPEEEEKLAALADKGEGKESQEYDSTIFTDVMPTLEQQLRPTDLAKDYQKHKFLDLSKPLLPQMWNSNFSKEFYLDEVHRPRHCGDKSADIFGVWFLEPFSKTPWWLIPLVWLPIAYYFLKHGFEMLPLPAFCIIFVIGIIEWTLLEYGIHRFVFHLDDYVPPYKVFYILHFLMHGVHHLLPMDNYRLVMPPALFCILASPFYFTYFHVLPYSVAYALFGANLVGYVYYDLCHYAMHHAELPGFLHPLKKHHIEHHYKNYTLGFGITNRFWDNVFHTNFGVNAPCAASKLKKTD